MFPKIMNDENFFKKAAAHGEEPPLTPQNEHQRSGLRFARRVRLPRAVGLAGMFLPIASTLVSHPPPGWWWLVLVGWPSFLDFYCTTLTIKKLSFLIVEKKK